MRARLCTRQVGAVLGCQSQPLMDAFHVAELSIWSNYSNKNDSCGGTGSDRGSASGDSGGGGGGNGSSDEACSGRDDAHGHSRGSSSGDVSDRGGDGTVVTAVVAIATTVVAVVVTMTLKPQSVSGVL
ncbi:hypothetical protein E2542_SST16532 [Spatholobus suberectus]|nr:hypothetical protein E2542_SST16532 [Spatholobus suberectus]